MCVYITFMYIMLQNTPAVLQKEKNPVGQAWFGSQSIIPTNLNHPSNILCYQILFVLHGSVGMLDENAAEFISCIHIISSQ